MPPDESHTGVGASRNAQHLCAGIEADHVESAFGEVRYHVSGLVHSGMV